MNCPACDYKNPIGATVCVECGSGLEWTAHREAEQRFKRQLDTTVRRVVDRGRGVRRADEQDYDPEL